MFYLSTKVGKTVALASGYWFLLMRVVLEGNLEEFSNTGNVLFLDLGAGYKAGAIYGNSLNCTLTNRALLRS